VVLGTDSPAEPARQGIEKFGSWGDANNIVAVYQGLIDAWEAGGRPAAPVYLQQQRDATLSRLKLA